MRRFLATTLWVVFLHGLLFSQMMAARRVPPPKNPALLPTVGTYNSSQGFTIPPITNQETWLGLNHPLHLELIFTQFTNTDTLNLPNQLGRPWANGNVPVVTVQPFLGVNPN